MSESDLDPTHPGHDAASPSHPSQPRPGTQPSAPSASHYMPELPYAEELQELLEGKYIVESFLGQGGMGAVYRGLQMPLKRPVAIKILAKQQEGVQDDFDFEERFKREAYAMASLTHPNIVQVYDCGNAGEHWLFISMELVDGGDLSDAIKNGLVTPEAALGLIGPICDGLHAAHGRGIVHRDIKPANIFLTSDGKPKVADFGLAKKFDVKETLVTKTGMGMGTPDYAAPEQYEGVSDIDHRADIYALGVMFYQMLTGSLPRGAYKPPSHRVPVDPRLDDVVSKSMEQDRAERYQSVLDLKADVQQILATWMAGPKPMPATRTGAVPAAARPTGQVRTGTQAPLRTGPVQHRSQTQYQQAPPEKSGTGLLAGAFIAFVLIAAGAFFVMKKPEPHAQESTGPVEPIASSSASSSQSPAPSSVLPTSSSPQASSSSAASQPAPMVSSLPVVANPSPSAVKTFAGHRYQFVPQKGLLFSEAKAQAESMGGHLATITSTEEQDFVVQLFRDGWPNRPNQVWIGGMRTEKGPEGWRWITGEPFSFRAWSPGSPSGNTVGHCLTLSLYGSKAGWNDFESPESRPTADGNIQGFIVEWDGAGGPPGSAPVLASAPAAPTVSMAPSTPAAPAAPPSAPADLEITDVLALVDLGKHVIPFAAQEWRKGANGLEMANPQNPGNTKGAVELPVVVAKSYALEATFKTRNILGEFGFVLPVGEGGRVACHITSAADGWAGLDTVDGKQVNEPGITAGVATPFKTPRDEPITMRAEVRRISGEVDVKFLINGQLMGAYKGPVGRLGVHRSWKPGDNKDAAYLAARHNAGGFQTTFTKVTYKALDLVAEVAAHDPRLAQLSAGFKTRYEADAEKPFTTALAALNQSYVANGIARARAAAQSKGDLKEVTALDEEKARIEKGEEMPAEDPPDTPASLKGLRAAYRGAVVKLEHERAKSAGPVFDIYLKALDAHATELTRLNKVDEAEKIRLVRTHVAEEKAALQPDFSASRSAPTNRPPR